MYTEPISENKNYTLIVRMAKSSTVKYHVDFLIFHERYYSKQLKMFL